MNPNLPPDDRAELEARVTALLLGETTAEEAAALRQQMSQDPALAKVHDRLRLTLDLVRESAATSAGQLSEQPAPLKLSPAKREALLAHFKTVRPAELARPRARRMRLVVELAAAAAIVLLLALVLLPKLRKTVVATGPTADVRKMSQAVGALDSTNNRDVELYLLTYADSKAIAQEVKDVFNSATNGAAAGGKGLIGSILGGGGGRDGRGTATDEAKRTGPRVNAVSDDQNNAVIVNAPLAMIPAISNLIEKLDIPQEDTTITKLFTLENGDSTEMANELRAHFQDQSAKSAGNGVRSGRGAATTATGGGTQAAASGMSERLAKQEAVNLVPDRRTQSLLVTASKDNMAQIEQIIAKMDAQPSAPLSTPSTPSTPSTAEKPATVPGTAIYTGNPSGNEADLSLAAPASPANQGVKLNLRNVTVDQALSFLSEKAGFNINRQKPTSPPDVSGTVDIVSDTPLSRDETVALFNNVLATHNLTAIQDKNNLTIMSIEDAQNNALAPVKMDTNYELIAPDNQVVTEIIPVHTLDPKQVVTNLYSLTPPGTIMNTSEAGNAIIVTGSQADVRKMSQDVTALDSTGNGDLQTFLLSYADSKAIAQELKEVFSTGSNGVAGAGGGGVAAIFGGGGGGRGGGAGGTDEARRPKAGHVNAVSDDQNNAVLISAPKDFLPGISNLISKLDIPQENNTEVKKFTLRNADSADIASELHALFPDENARASVNAGARAGRGTAMQFAGGGGGASSGMSERQARQGTVNAVADPRTQSVVVTASKDTMSQIEQIVGKMDAMTYGHEQVYTYKPVNGDAAGLTGPLSDMFQQNGKSTASSATQNALMQRMTLGAQNMSTTAASSVTAGGGSGGGGGGGGAGGGARGGAGGSANSLYATQGNLPPVSYTVDPISGTVNFITSPENRTNAPVDTEFGVVPGTTADLAMKKLSGYPEKPVMEERTFHVDPSTFYRGMAGVAMTGISGSNNVGSSSTNGSYGGGMMGGMGGGYGGGYANGSVLLTSNGNGGQMQGAVSYPTVNIAGIPYLTSATPTAAANQPVINYFNGIGVNLSATNGDGSFVIYNDKTGDMLVRAPLDKLDIVDRVVNQFNKTPQEVQVDAKFASVDQTDSKGFSSAGNVGNTTLNKDHLIAQGELAAGSILEEALEPPKLARQGASEAQPNSFGLVDGASKQSLGLEDSGDLFASSITAENKGRIEFDGKRANLDGSVDDTFGPGRNITVSRTGGYNGGIQVDEVIGMDGVSADANLNGALRPDSEAENKRRLIEENFDAGLAKLDTDKDGKFAPAVTMISGAVEFAKQDSDSEAKYKADVAKKEAAATAPELEMAEGTWLRKTYAGKIDGLETNGTVRQQHDQLAASSLGLDEARRILPPGHLSLTATNSGPSGSGQQVAINKERLLAGDMGNAELVLSDTGQQVAMNGQPLRNTNVGVTTSAYDPGWIGVLGNDIAANGPLTNGLMLDDFLTSQDVFVNSTNGIPSRVPSLGDIPFIGSLASHTSPAGGNIAGVKLATQGQLTGAPGSIVLSRTNGAVRDVSVTVSGGFDAKATKELGAMAMYDITNAGTLATVNGTNWPVAGSSAAFASGDGATAFWPLNETADAMEKAYDEPGYGLVASWPLKETNNPSAGKAAAYDVVGGYNGTYGANAENGGRNSAHAVSGANADSGKPNTTNMTLVASVNPATGATTTNRTLGGSSVYLGPATSFINNFGGFVSSSAMSSNSLSPGQLQSLFDAGTATGGASYTGAAPVSSAAVGEGRIQVDRVLTNDWSTNSYTLGTYTANAAAPGAFIPVIPKAQDGTAISPANCSPYTNGNLFTSELYALSGTNKGPEMSDDNYLINSFGVTSAFGKRVGSITPNSQDGSAGASPYRSAAQFTNGVFQFALDDKSAPAKTPDYIIGGSFAPYHGAALSSVATVLPLDEVDQSVAAKILASNAFVGYDSPGQFPVLVKADKNDIGKPIVNSQSAGEQANIQYNWSMPVEQVLDEIYAPLVGRTPLRAPSVPKDTMITLNTEKPLTKTEAIQALEGAMGMNGITVVPMGDKYFKVVLEANAPQAGGTLKSNTAPSSIRNPQSAIRNPEPPAPKPTPQSPIPQPEVQTRDNAFSTFSLNVSDVSFKLAAASLQNGLLPDPAAVRSEEFINAFDYRGPEPVPGAAIGFDWERAGYPFAHNRDLLRFAVKTATEGRQAGRPLNLVLLLDKSGSMERADRVAIIREALRVLASQLKAQDVLSVVVFARTARLWADGVPGSRAGALAAELEALTPEGGTNLEEAMKLAYEAALRHYLANGENRVVLLTDGAANLGDVEPGDLKKKVEVNRAQGIALDCFGVGWEDYNDTLLEVLSRSGGGRYGFVNTPEEAATEFAGQLAGALRVAASDVKVQVEFNPARVISWRQIGYAKDQLKKEQFRDNSVKAAQMTVAEAGNALYTVELNPAGDGPVCTVYVRYREPGTSDYFEHAWAVPYDGAAPTLDKASPAMRLAATASAFSEWLAGSPYAGDVRLDPLQSYLRGVPEFYGIDARPKLLETMLREARSISGK